MSLSRSRSRSRSPALASIAPTLVQESPVECPDALLDDSEVDEDTLFYPPQAGDHEEMPKAKPQQHIEPQEADIQPQQNIEPQADNQDIQPRAEA